MKKTSIGSLWEYKTCRVGIGLLVLLAVGLPAWLGASDYPGRETFVYIALFFFVLEGLCMIAYVGFITELKRINDVIWKPIALLLLAAQIFLLQRYNGLLSLSEDRTLHLSYGTMSWILGGFTISLTIGYLLLHFYNRSRLKSENRDIT